MRDLPLSLLRSLAAVRAEGGIRPAARRLGVEHSAVSRALRELEAYLGAPLTEPRRRGERIKLTPHGRDLADKAFAAMNDLEKSLIQFREPTGPMQVTIATPPSVAARWLLPKLPDLQRHCPGVEVSIVVDQPRRATIDPNIELTLRMGSVPNEVDHAIILGSDTAFPVMSPLLWEKLGRPSDVEQLHKLRLLHDRDSTVNWTNWREKVGPHDLDVRSGPRLTSSDLSLRAAEQGQGIALTRGWLVGDALDSGKLIRPFGEASLSLPCEWWLCEGMGTKERLATRKVREWLVSICLG